MNVKICTLQTKKAAELLIFSVVLLHKTALRAPAFFPVHVKRSAAKRGNKYAILSQSFVALWVRLGSVDTPNKSIPKNRIKHIPGKLSHKKIEKWPFCVLFFFGVSSFMSIAKH